MREETNLLRVKLSYCSIVYFGANYIFLYVSHCENTLVLPKKDEKSGETVSPIAKYDGLIDRVYTTNSIFTEKHEKVEVV